MRLSHQIERYLLGAGHSTVREVADWFGLSEQRCREALLEIEPYGVELTSDGRVLLEAE